MNSLSTSIDRRQFLVTTGLATGGLALGGLIGLPASAQSGVIKRPARVRAAFLYPPSTTFSENPDGWWSWPGNDFDAEGRHKKYLAALREMEKKLGVKIVADERPIGSTEDAQRLGKEIQADRPDGLVLIMFSAMRERIAHADVPIHFQGAPIGLITAGLMALAFMGFTGLANL